MSEPSKPAASIGDTGMLGHPPRTRILALLAGTYLAAGLALRIVLFGAYAKEAGIAIFSIVPMLLSGLMNDSIALVYILIPLSIYVAIVPQKIWESWWHRLLAFAIAFGAVFGLIYLSAVEFYFFDEFQSRFNLVAVDYLIYPHEVLINIWESYPVVQIMAAIGLVALIVVGLSWRTVRPDFERTSTWRRRFAWLGIHAILVAAVTLALSAETFARFDNRVEREIALNGVATFFKAFRTNELNYPLYYVTEDDAVAWTTVRQQLVLDGSRFATDRSDDLNRVHHARPDGLGQVNVVLVVEESLGCEFVGACGDTRGLTPTIDRLSNEGLFFANAYSTGTRTVRGLEAITASFPPIPSEAVVKRPGSENIATWGSVMRKLGYSTSFLYGGYGTFDNMNHFYETNGFEVTDRRDIPNPRFANIWGVADEDLFDHAIAHFDAKTKAGKPFFALIMSTSNHKPFTFRAGVPGVPVEGGGREAGARYADFAVGQFLENAKSHPWFDRTIFVVIADHGARVYGHGEIPMKTYRIPAVVWAPGLIEPRTVDTLFSQLDLAPTVLSMMGVAYTAPFYGQDIFAPRSEPRNILLNHNHDVALYRDGKLLVLGLNKSVSMYEYDEAADTQTPIPIDPFMQRLATSYFQTAFDLFQRHAYE